MEYRSIPSVVRRSIALVAAALLAVSACSTSTSSTGTTVPTSGATSTTLTPSTTTSSTTPPTTTPATTAPATTGPATTEATTTEPATTSAPTTLAHPPLVLSAYFLRDERVGVVHRTVPYTVATSRAALQQLLAGPTIAEQAIGMGTAIPAGTVLNNVSIVAGVATVDLSGTYASGGGTLSLMARLAQVVFTATQFPSVHAVLLKLDGVTVELFGGEGIMIDGPLTRANFENMTPAVLLEGPAPFDRVGTSVRMWGTANTFEATFMVRITDPHGTVVYEHFQMATSGSGTRGTWDVTVTIHPTAHGRGSLRVWASSPEDGHDIDVVTIPIDM